MMFSQWPKSHGIFKPLAKALIRLPVCAGLAELLLVAHTTFLEMSCRGSNLFYLFIFNKGSVMSHSLKLGALDGLQFPTVHTSLIFLFFI